MIFMSAEVRDGDLEARRERGRMKVLALVALYLVLAVTVGVVRSELQASGAARSPPAAVHAAPAR